MILKELENITPERRKAFVIKHKKEILKAKKSVIKVTSPLIFTPTLVKSQSATKAENEKEPNTYEIVGNSIGFLDSHMDVSMPGSFNKTVKEGGQNVPILINHKHSPEAIFAKNMGVSVKMISIKDLGYKKDGETEALTAKISPVYDHKMSQLYEGGEIKQHSIGLRYIKIDLAVNDSSDNEGYANWTKYIDQVINREEAEKYGYFFPVFEQKLIEISAVLLGSNPYTPTLNNKSDNSLEYMIEPSNDEDTRLSKEPKGADKSFLLTVCKNLSHENTIQRRV